MAFPAPAAGFYGPHTRLLKARRDAESQVLWNDVLKSKGQQTNPLSVAYAWQWGLRHPDQIYNPISGGPLSSSGTQFLVSQYHPYQEYIGPSRARHPVPFGVNASTQALYFDRARAIGGVPPGAFFAFPSPTGTRRAASQSLYI